MRITSAVILTILTLTATPLEARRTSFGLQEKRSEVLDERYRLEWQADFDNETIEFWITTQATGFVGFGLSVSGQMDGADLVIGGVRDGQVYFKDYHGVDHRPVEDAVQNWDPVEITEMDGQTSLHLRRKLETCDRNDTSITEGTVKLLWSLGSDDNIKYHEIRGALAVNILDPPPKQADLSKFNTYNVTQTINMTSEYDTIYWCHVFKRSTSTKSQVVAFKPKLETPEGLAYTHHFNMYKCILDPGMDADEYFGPLLDSPGQHCYINPGELSKALKYCNSNFYAWSLGGRILVFPDNIGLTWGEETNEYFLFQSHLDNPMRASAMVDTGVTIYHTEETRPIEAGLFAIGHVTAPSLLIPPSTQNWTLAGHCSPDCLSQSLPEQGINVFNINLHAHISGRKMKLRHFRNGKELPWIAKDDTYDFDFQENRPLSEPVRILRGDQVTLECTFDSTWKSPSGTVIGGYSSFDEMCMVFAFYYPRSAIEYCYSTYPLQQVYNSFGIEEAEFPEGNLDAIVQKPEKWVGRNFSDIATNEFTWNDAVRAEFQDELRFGSHEAFCNLGSKPEQFASFLRNSKAVTPLMSVAYPDVEEYEEEVKCN